jgi:hypothetical protein
MASVLFKRNRMDVAETVKSRTVIYYQALEKMSDHERSLLRSARLGELDCLRELCRSLGSQASGFEIDERRNAAEQHLDEFENYFCAAEVAETYFAVRMAKHRLDFPPYDVVAIKVAIAVGVSCYFGGIPWAVIVAAGSFFWGQREINKAKVLARADLDTAEHDHATAKNLKEAIKTQRAINKGAGLAV